jgi:cobalt-zinc-cadmium efflux system outer membrane protein
VRRVELSLQNRLAESFNEYLKAKQQVDRYLEDILPDAEDTLDLIGNGYRQGEFGYLALLTSQRTYFTGNLAYLQALRDLWISATRIEGMLLKGGLDRPGE